MASDSGDLEARGLGLPAEVREFRRATTASFNALRSDMLDVRARFDGVDRRFAEIRGRLDAAAAGQQQIVDLIQTLIDDRRHG